MLIIELLCTHTCSPYGGQLQPIDTGAENACEKYTQNNEKKNIISVVINKINPSFRFDCTIKVCFPCRDSNHNLFIHVMILYISKYKQKYSIILLHQLFMLYTNKKISRNKFTDIVNG
jgi:hypothetical protein